jgi:hypothetical protein
MRIRFRTWFRIRGFTLKSYIKTATLYLKNQTGFNAFTLKNRHGTAPVTDGEGQLVPVEYFLSQLNPPSSSGATDKPHVGASLRWAVAADPEKLLRLEIQGLPAAPTFIQKKYFQGDNAVSILLGSFPLNADMFDGSTALGLVPIFFSAKPQEALHHLNNNPDATKEITTSINSRLLIMEHLSMDAASAYISAKKGRMAKGVPAFPAPTVSRKRGRPTNTGISGSGT